MDGEPKEVSKFYEKLLFSKSDKIPKIVDEIVANNSFNAKPVIIKDKPKQKSTGPTVFGDLAWWESNAGAQRAGIRRRRLSLRWWRTSGAARSRTRPQ
mgnify:CR=1 FL=1